jgi:hypothetical protein
LKLEFMMAIHKAMQFPPGFSRAFVATMPYLLGVPNAISAAA